MTSTIEDRPADPADVLAEVRRLFAEALPAAVPELLGPDDAARFLGLSQAAVYRLAAAGRIRQVAVPGCHAKFRKTDLVKWLAGLRPSR